MLRIRRRKKCVKVPVQIVMVDVPTATMYGIVLHEKKRAVVYREVASQNFGVTVVV